MTDFTLATSEEIESEIRRRCDLLIANTKADDFIFEMDNFPHSVLDSYQFFKQALYIRNWPRTPLAWMDQNYTIPLSNEELLWFPFAEPLIAELYEYAKNQVALRP
jgi:hypothetical protein